jgi:hypothetical protein
MKITRTLAALLAASVVAALPAPAVSAAPKLKVLGTDPALDGPPSMDLTSIAVARMGKALQIRLDLELMTPPWGSAIPLLPGVQWAFDVKGRTFVAEAYTDPQAGPGFLLFEILDNGGFEQLATIDGSYDWQDGFVDLFVPLKLIRAKSGTKISGTGKKGTEDVDFHIHAGPQTHYADKMATTKDFIVP